MSRFAVFLFAAATLAAGCNVQPAAASAYVTDSSAEARTVQSLLEFVEAGNDRQAAALITAGVRIVVEADVAYDLNANVIRRYVLPRVSNCGSRILRRTYRLADGRAGVDVSCEHPRSAAPLEGRSVSFEIRGGMIAGANTNDGQLVNESANGR